MILPGFSNFCRDTLKIHLENSPVHHNLHTIRHWESLHLIYNGYIRLLYTLNL